MCCSSAAAVAVATLWLRRAHVLGADPGDVLTRVLDHQLASMTDELGKVGDLVRSLERDRHHAFGELANELRRQHEGLNTLTEHTHQLREVLSSSQARGQWGERMAEDVLRLAGFLEGVNYRKQTSLPGRRPPRLHVLDAERVAAPHGREVPARQLRALPRGRQRPRAGSASATSSCATSEIG